MSVDLEIALRLLLAAALGAIIGYQRERYKKPAGLRTHMLICLGSALFTTISEFGFGIKWSFQLYMWKEIEDRDLN